MRAQNQLSFANWQTLVLFTKKVRRKIFAVLAIGGGGRRRSMAAEVTVNDARWWLMEKREEKNKLQQLRLSKKIIAAMKAAQKSNCSNEGCPKK